MATNNYQVKQLSTPAVYVDGELIAVVPNSVVVHVPGDGEVRAMSMGGGAVQIVTGIDAKSFVGHVKMDIPATGQNADRVARWKQKFKDSVPMTVLVAEDSFWAPHQQMYMNKSTDLHLSSDGKIGVEFFGAYQA